VEVFMRVLVNLIAFVFLAIVLYMANLRLDKCEKSSKLFLWTCRLVLTALLLEALTCVLDGKSSVIVNVLLRMLLALLYSLPPVMAYFWSLLPNALTEGEDNSINKTSLAPLIPAVANAGMAILSAFLPCLYFIDENNVYHRGQLLPILITITVSYMLAGLYFLFRQRDKLFKGDVKFLWIIFLFPMLGGILQVQLNGALLMWSMVAGSLIVLYVYLQERMIQVDSLTGAWTRQAFSQHLSQIAGKCKNEPLGILFLDIDELKAINDQYGHIEGDAALQAFSDVARSQLRRNDIIARIGGDEFVILAFISDPKDLRAIEEKIELALDNYNMKSPKPYRLTCSIGSKLYEASCGIREAIADVDRLMYEQKFMKKPCQVSGTQPVFKEIPVEQQ